MPRFLIFCLLLAVPSIAGPLSINNQLQCAVCQLIGVSTAQKTGANREAAISHCFKFTECQKQLSDCDIISTVHKEIGKDGGKFENSKAGIKLAAEKCAADSNALVLSEDATSVKCSLCFLVYDVLKYINYNILLNPMLGNVKTAIELACSFIGDDICQVLLQPDTLNAIIRGLQDSLGGFYDLIAVQGFNCPKVADLFGQC